MPRQRLSKKQREELNATSMLDQTDSRLIRKCSRDGQVQLIKRAASYPEVERVLVHPAIKKALCEAAGPDRGWLGKVRPIDGHYYHFHIRIGCPPGSTTCKPQKAPTGEDGCGKEVQEWLARLAPSKTSACAEAAGLQTQAAKAADHAGAVAARMHGSAGKRTRWGCGSTRSQDRSARHCPGARIAEAASAPGEFCEEVAARRDVTKRRSNCLASETNARFFWVRFLAGAARWTCLCRRAQLREPPICHPGRAHLREPGPRKAAPTASDKFCAFGRLCAGSRLGGRKLPWPG